MKKNYKEALKKHYFNNHLDHKDLRYISWHQFQDLDLAFQWGVILDFFDSVGLIIECSRDGNGFYYIIGCVEAQCGGFKTRKEAQQSAFDKAKEIYETK